METIELGPVTIRDFVEYAFWMAGKAPEGPPAIIVRDGAIYARPDGAVDIRPPLSLRVRRGSDCSCAAKPGETVVFATSMKFFHDDGCPIKDGDDLDACICEDGELKRQILGVLDEMIAEIPANDRIVADPLSVEGKPD